MTVLSAVDLVPSLLRLADVEAPSAVRFDGVDMSDAVLGRAAAGWSQPLFWKRPPDGPGPPEDPT